MKPKLFSIVGAGRLGTALGAALVRRGWKCAVVIDTDPRAAREGRRRT
jgi:2-polyprenyl-6-methoxyphenol hydroxylase-like FAD-dependent oxidoreductase